MGYYNYDYLEIGLFNPISIAVLATLVIIMAVVLFYLVSKTKKNTVTTVGSRMNTLNALVKQNYVGKYSNSYLGIIWNFLLPLLLVFTICNVFMSIKNVYPGRDYGVYICAGFFVATVCRYGLTGRTFKTNSQLVRKTDAPGWLMAIADTISQFITLVIALVATLVVRSGFGDRFTIESLLWIPVLLVILFVFCFGCTLLFSVVAVLWDDLGQIISLLARIIVWVTPVFFYISDCKSSLESACMWNPFTYFIETFHQTISYGVAPNLMMILLTLLLACFTLLAGLIMYVRYFDKVREQA